MELERERDRSSAYIEDEVDIFIRNVNLLRKQWDQVLHTLLNVKSPKFDPNIDEDLDQWTENIQLRVPPMVKQLTSAICSLANGNTVDRTESPLSCSISPLTVIPPCDGDRTI